MSPHSPRARYPRLMLLTIATATAFTLTACGLGGHSESARRATAVPSASPAAQGVVTKAAAEQTLNTYEKNQQPGQRHAERQAILATVEAGQLNVQSRADYEQFKTFEAKEQQRYRSPFSYEDREYYIPGAGTADWFAVKARSSESADGEALMIFDKVGGTYKLTLAVHTDKESIPPIARDRDGIATAVDPARRVGPLAADQLSKALEDLVETGGRNEGRKLASTPLTRQSLKLHRDRNKRTAGQKGPVTWTTNFVHQPPAHPTVYALRLADGGVISLFPTARTAEYLNKPQYRSSRILVPGPTQALYDSRPRDLITDEYQGQAMAVLHPHRKARVIAQEYRLVDAR
ncbi:hypothetical protein ACFYOV_31815 [Streptomyces sp. NPDC005931]|uniref:hypothetical protein n=1 Tax=Streptomyces sp. NPDC005931 TaxID=3364737 RepID=UPI0036A0C2B7